ncbi:AAA family ATPase [Gillisia sp. Q332]|uniref:AAA family ATPase n=1 Tax=Gillisia xinjiangensis TaxID=3384765 RepID=UPI00391C988B
MNLTPKGLLQKGFNIEGKYTVTFFLKKGSYAETYRVKDKENHTRLLKLISFSKLDKTQFTAEGEVLEIQILKEIKHPNVVSLIDSGTLILKGQKFAFGILNFISGETLADKMRRDHTFNPYDSKDVICDVLNGLEYLHSLRIPVIHNDITNLNIMTDLSGENPVAKIIDFGYARYLDQSQNAFNRKGLNPFYMAPESFNRVFSVQTDIFSVGALYYHLLFGLPPWFVEVSKYKNNADRVSELIEDERRKPLRVIDTNSQITPQTLAIITKALSIHSENRFTSTTEFLKALNGKIILDNTPTTNATVSKPSKKEVRKGEGFKAIAGMQELKELLQLDVIDALNEPERYAEYGLTIPNGMLLYGPPGCGKTFFAEKLAEEIGFNFYQIKPSDIQSKWVNQSQENIAALFKEAKENAPSIIFIDELDAVVPNRNDSNINHMNTSAVNEFLAQMNNSGEDGVFIIGATNRPTAIDPAVLRAGRLDKIIYLPPPDMEARKLMFRLYLEKRPREIGLDYEALASATENYVSSDIKFLSDEASRKALRSKERITKELVLQTIKENRPSISLSELQKYDGVRAKLEGIKSNTTERPTIGFK